MVPGGYFIEVSMLFVVYGEAFCYLLPNAVIIFISEGNPLLP